MSVILCSCAELLLITSTKRWEFERWLTDPCANSKAWCRRQLDLMGCTYVGSGASKHVLVAQLCLTLCDPMVCPWDSLGKDTGVDCHLLLQGIFPIQGWNLGLLHCRQTLYHLNYQGMGDTVLILILPCPCWVTLDKSFPTLWPLTMKWGVFVFKVYSQEFCESWHADGLVSWEGWFPPPSPARAAQVFPVLLLEGLKFFFA